MDVQSIDFLFEENPNPMWIYDPSDLSIKQANQAASELYGYSMEELESLTIADLRPESEIPKLKEELAKKADAFNNAGLWQHRKKNGDPLFVRVLSHPVSEGDRTYKLVTVHDATNEVQYQRELGMMLENSLDGIMLSRPDGRILRANKAACSILDMTEEEIIQKGREGIVHKDEMFEKALQKRKKTGSYSGELTFLHRSGRKLTVDLSTSVYANLQGEKRTSIVFRDVTGRRETEQQLKESLNRFHYATKATYDAIWDWDLRSDYIHWGEGFENLFGHDLESLPEDSSSWTNHIHHDDREWVYDSIREAIEGDHSRWFEEYRYRKADGSYRMVEDRGYIIRDEDGEAVRMIGAMRDVTERRDLEKLLDQAYSLARIGAWEVDMKNGQLYWSSITRRLHEVESDFEPDLDQGINFYKEGESRETIRKLWNRAIEEGTPWDVELQIVTAKGNVRWVRTKGEPVMVDGQCRRVYGIFQDINERRQAREKMLEALQERERILERITVAFFAVDENWTVTYWNNQAEEIIGVSREEVLNQNLWEQFPEAKELAFFKEYERALKEQTPTSFEEYYPPLNVWLEVNSYPSPDGLSVFFRDITDRKQDQLDLEKAYREKETILESIGDGFFTVNEEWTVTYWNSAAEHLLKTPKDIILGKNLWDIFNDASDRPSYANYHKAMDEGEPVEFRDYYEALDRWFDVSAYPAEEGISVYFKDITEQKQREAQLQESLKEKETLLAEVHHRVKNNLAVVSGMMQLQAFGEEDDTVRSKLHDSVGRIKTMALIHELLYQSESFSRLDSSENIEKLVEEIARSHGPSVELDVEFELQKVELNINQAMPVCLIVNEVVTNIYKHAFEAGDSGMLRVSTGTGTSASTDQTFRLEITDDGKGLPDDFPESAENGSLGLQLIDTLAEQLDAEYRYRSGGGEDGEDGETVFSLTFEKTDVRGPSATGVL
ncbi:MAG: PAS domain S-box protein [Balneolaceae bacterium]|nr:PAS domain S-box protein [Balneolaceae bacterium]